MDSRNSIIRSIKHFFSATVLSRISGLVRDMSMAWAFGSDPSVAALMVSFRFTNLLRRILGEGALQNAFVPHFEYLRAKSSSEAKLFFKDLSMSLAFSLLLITLFVETCLYASMSFLRVSQETYDILYLTALMFPAVVFICHFGLNASLLQCERKYFTVGIAPFAFNITWIVAVIFLKDFSVTEAVPFLAYCVVLACFFQYLLTVPYTMSVLRPIPWRKGRLFSQEVRVLFKPLSLGLIGVGASQLNSALDALFARYADLSGPAYLWYSIRLQQLPLALFGLALTQALLPPLSRAIQSKDEESYVKFLAAAIRTSVTFMLPVTWATILLGDSSVVLLYGRGGFSEVAAEQTTYCLWAYIVALLPTVLVSLFASASYARGDYHKPTQAAVSAVILNIALNAWMVFGLGLGAVSVALATSLSAFLNCWLLGRSLLSVIGEPRLFSLRMHFLKVLFLSVAAFFVTWLVGTAFWADASLLKSGQNIAFSFSRSFSWKLAHLLFLSTTFLFTSLAMGRVLKVKL